MNATMRRILTANRVSRRLYFAVRQTYRIHQTAKSADRHFVNGDDFRSALRAHDSNELVDLHTADGLTITIRRNYGYAMTVAEIFGGGDCYVRDVRLSDNPVVIDIGGFVGDFSLYAVKRLNARKVIVCEPSPRNWELLVKNISTNGYVEQIEALNKAVTNGRDVMMNVDAPDECQSMVSAHYQSGQKLTAVSGISLAELIKLYALEEIDLLKIDCEGGEFEILESTPSEVFIRIHNIVFEYHQVEDVWNKLDSVQKKLRREGYTLRKRGGLISASRSQNGPRPQA